MPDPMTAEVDIVIPTRDRLSSLKACLEGLAGQTFKRFQVILVDDGSQDPLETQLPKVSVGVGPIHVVRLNRSVGPAASRNRGFAEGHAPFVLFLDDDSLSHPELVARHYAVLSQSPEPVVSFGRLMPPTDERLEPWNSWQADRLAREYSKLERGESEPSWIHVYTGNVAMRRADFASVNGFDESFARQEDIELGLRLHRAGCRFVFEPSALVWHYTHRDLHSWLGVPRASAYYDLLIARSSQAQGLGLLEERMRQKHWLLRLFRGAFGHPWLEPCAVWAAATTGRGLHALGFDRLSMLAFSLVWDLQYNRGLRNAIAELRPSA